jgi:hypothetical protein
MILTPEVVTDTVLEWFQNLDYEYMVLHIIICYGLYYSKNLKWIVELYSPIRKKGISKAVWLIGGVLAILEMLRFIPVIIEHNLSVTMTVDRFVAILHSYVVIQVFVEPIVNTIHKWVTMFKKTTDSVIDMKSDKIINSNKNN